MESDFKSITNIIDSSKKRLATQIANLFLRLWMYFNWLYNEFIFSIVCKIKKQITYV